MENTQKQSSLPLYYLKRFSQNPESPQVGLAEIDRTTSTSLVELKTVTSISFLDQFEEGLDAKASELIEKIVNDARLPKSNSEETSLIRKICYAFSSFPAFKEDEENLLEIKLIHNQAEKPFLTSDNPVVFLNPSLESKNKIRANDLFTSEGLQIIFPISPDFAFLFFDSKIYKVGATAMKTVEVKDDALAQRINLLQVINCRTNCYFSEHLLDFEVETLMRKGTKFRNDAKHLLKQRTIEDIKGPELCVANQKLNFIKEIHEIKKMAELEAMPQKDKYGRYPKPKY